MTSVPRRGGLVIERLTRDHPVEAFDCAVEPLNRFLVRYALSAQLSGSSRTYVALSGRTVVGYHTLTFGAIDPDNAPERIRKGLPQHPVPLMVLARLAVDLGWQGKGLGAGLLKDAMLRTIQAAEIAGLRAMAVHAKDEGARRFYQHFNFVPSPMDPMHLFLLVKDVRAFVAD